MSKFDASVTTKRKNKEEEEQKSLAKTFAAWINLQIKPLDAHVDDIFTDLSNGVNLILLLEAVTQKNFEQTLNAKYKKAPKSTVEKVENVALAIKFMNDFMGLKLNVNSQDIVDGNRKIIIMILWRMISSGLARQGESETEANKPAATSAASDKTKQVKEKLMQWTKSQLEGYKDIEVDDLDDSFSDGRIFCALVHKFDNSLLDFDALDKEKSKENLELAFKLAEQHLGIPALLDVDDVINVPDERSIMVYLAQYPVAFLSQTKVDTANVKKYEEELEQQKVKAQEEEENRKKELEVEQQKRKEKEEEQERLRVEREELENEISKVSAEDYPELHAERRELLEENLRLKEELGRLQKEKERLNFDLLSTKKKLIGSLKVNVHQGRDLREKIIHGGVNHLDSFVKVALDTQSHRTRIKMRTNKPKWEQEFTLFVSEAESSNVEVVVHSWHLLWKPGFRGRVVIPIKDLKPGQEVSKWFKLLPDDNHKQQEYGEIRLTLNYKLGV